MSHNPTDEQEATRLRIKALIDRYHTTHPGDPYPPAQPDTSVATTALLNTTPDIFTAWLHLHTRPLTRRKLPTPGGFLTPQKVRQVKNPPDDTSNLIILTIDGILHEPTGGSILQYKLMLFTLFPLETGGIALQAKCNNIALAPYYTALLSLLTAQFT